MEVRATKPGFYGQYRNEGDKFEVADDAKGSWFVPTEVKAQKAEPTEVKAPRGKAQKAEPTEVKDDEGQG